MTKKNTGGNAKTEDSMTIEEAQNIVKELCIKDLAEFAKYIKEPKLRTFTTPFLQLFKENRLIHMQHEKDLLNRVKAYEKWNEAPKLSKDEKYDPFNMYNTVLKYFTIYTKELAYIIGGTTRSIMTYDIQHTVRDKIRENFYFLNSSIKAVQDRHNDPRWWIHEDEVFLLIINRYKKIYTSN